MRVAPGMIAGISLAAILAAPADAAGRLDAHFMADRVLVDAPLKNGGHIRFWTDTGGGGTILYDRAAARLKLATKPMTGPIADDLPPGSLQLAGPIPIRGGAFPTPPAPVLVGADQLAQMGLPSDSDGNIGQNWFAGRIWTWNYPKGILTIEPGNWRPPVGAHVIPVGFRKAAQGRPALHFPRITIDIAGEPVSVLLDTGATTVLTAEAAKAIDGGPRLRATSMITASRIRAWRSAHPDWLVVEKAQGGTGSRMIRVPDVKVAGLQLGPVWFTERADKNFTEMMSSSMDAPVEGALGGNAYRDLMMTIDYRQGRAAFSRAR